MIVSLVICPIWNIDEPPLAPAYLAGQLKANGHRVFCHDFSMELFNGISEEDKKVLGQTYLSAGWVNEFNYWKDKLCLEGWTDKWARRILSNNPDVIGFTVYDATLSTSLLLAETLRRYSPETIVVFGGPSCMNKEILNKGPIDFLVYGEGEMTIIDLLGRLQLGESVDDCRGIVFKKNGESVRTEARPLIEDINTIPLPDFDGFDLNRYPARMLPMFTSRGCYNSCSFCSEKSRWIRFRHRSAENIVTEMERNVNKYGIRHFDMTDSVINGSLPQFEKMCDLIIERGLRVTWGGKARVHRKMDLPFMKKAKKAGCRLMIFGLESASQRVLDHMEKNVKMTDVENTIINCHNAGIRVGGFFIIGYVNETEEDFQKTIDFVKKNYKYIDRVYPGNGLVILKGSPLSEDPEKYDCVMPENSPDGKWRSSDGINTDLVRKERVARFNNMIYENQINDLRAEREKALTAASKLVKLGEHCFGKGDHNEAVEIFMRVSEIAPDNFVNWNNLGVALLTQGMPDEARNCFIRSISLNGDYADSQENLRKLETIRA